MIAERELIRRSNLMETIKQGVGGTKGQKREALEAIDKLHAEFAGKMRKRDERVNGFFAPGSMSGNSAAERAKERIKPLLEERDRLKALISHPEPDQDLFAIAQRITDLDVKIQMEQAFQKPNLRF